MNLLKMLSLFQVLSFTAPAHMFRKALDAMLDSLEDQIAASATPSGQKTQPTRKHRL